jgi:hypothetical protein
MKRPSMKSRVQAQSSAPDMSGAADRCSTCWGASQPWSELSTVSAQARWRWQRLGPGQPGPAESGSGSTRVSGGTSHVLRARPAGNGGPSAGPPRAGGHCPSSALAAARAVRAVAGGPAADQGAAVWAWDGASAPGQALPDRPGARAGALCPQAAVWGAEGAVRELVRARVDGAPAQVPVRAAGVCGGSCRTGRRDPVQAEDGRVPVTVPAPAAGREVGSGGSSQPGDGPPGGQEDGQERAVARAAVPAACGQLGQSPRARPRPSQGVRARHCAGWFREGSGGTAPDRPGQRLLRSGGAREPKATAAGCAGSEASSCAASPGPSAGRCGARSGRCEPRPGISEGHGASSCAARHGSAGPASCWLPSLQWPGFASCTAGTNCARRSARASGVRSRGWESPSRSSHGGFRGCTTETSSGAAGSRSGTSA